MTNTEKVRSLLSYTKGVRCKWIIRDTDLPRGTVSAILSFEKRYGKAINYDGLWFKTNISSDKIHISAWIEKETNNRFREFCVMKGMNISSAINEAMVRYIK